MSPLRSRVAHAVFALALLATSHAQAQPPASDGKPVDQNVKGPPPWEDPAVLNDPAKKAVFEFTPMFNHAPVRPAYALRIFESRPELAQHPEKLPAPILLGDMLFHAPPILGPRAQFFGLSCASCHPNGAATPDIDVGPQTHRPGTIDMLSDYFTPLAEDGIFAPRSVPSLRGARYTAPYGRAGATASLGEFIDRVVTLEMGQQPLRNDWRNAIVLYLEQMDFLPDSQIDALGHLNPDASASAKAGEELFRRAQPAFDGMSCASCHVPESLFTDRKTHFLHHGTSDVGAREAFDTPSLLGLAETAPYFYDNSAATLRDAVAQIDSRHALKLSADEQASLVAYLEAVGHVDAKPAPASTASSIDHALAYLQLLLRGPQRGDAQLWRVCLFTISHQLRGALRDASAAEQAALSPSIQAFSEEAARDAAPSAERRTRLTELRDKIFAALHPSKK